MLHLATQSCVKREHLQCVDVDIHKIISTEAEPLETDMYYASGGMDPTNRHEVLRESLVRIVRVLVQYRRSFSVPLVPQL
jgi:hypothetical protein